MNAPQAGHKNCTGYTNMQRGREKNKTENLLKPELGLHARRANEE